MRVDAQELDQLERAIWTIVEELDFALDAIETTLADLAARVAQVEELLAAN